MSPYYVHVLFVCVPEEISLVLHVCHELVVEEHYPIKMIEKQMSLTTMTMRMWMTYCWLRWSATVKPHYNRVGSNNFIIRNKRKPKELFSDHCGSIDKLTLYIALKHNSCRGTCNVVQSL